MEKILKIKTFVPKNIDKRAEDLKRIQAKDLKEYDVFVKEFQQNLKNVKYKTSVDKKEQLFIDMIKDCDIKLDQNKYPFNILLFKDDSKLSCETKVMFEYDWKNETLWYSHSRVWSVFRDNFKMDYQQYQHFITDQIETHFNFRPSTIKNVN